MNIGKVPENILKDCVFSQIKTNRSELLVPPSIGEDCSVLKLEADEVFVVSTDPITGAANNIGTLAVHITANDIASEGAEVIGLMLTILLPDRFSKDSLKELMKEISTECDKLNIAILGGHTEVSPVVSQPIISVTGIGKAKADKIVKTSGALPNQAVIMTKFAGLEGTTILATDKEEKLISKMSQEDLENAKSFYKYLSVIPEAKIATEFGVSSMHDVTEGGILGAVWEVAESSNVGIVIDIAKIPVLHETKILCGILNINPFLLISSGSMLITVNDGEGLVEILNKNNINATIIGYTTADSKRVIIDGDNEVELTPPSTDELYNA